jgi:hypothetical protein
MKFFYNGIKGSDGKLQKCYYSEGPYLKVPSDVITIWGKNYKSFSEEVAQAFKVEDGSDMQSDYFENEHILVPSSHPLYPAVRAALEKQKEHIERRRLARAVRS